MHTGRPTTQCQRQRYPYHASPSGIMARAMVVAHCSTNGKLGVSAHLLLQYSTMGEHVPCYIRKTAFAQQPRWQECATEEERERMGGTRQIQ
jgi:hypothetical protein